MNNNKRNGLIAIVLGLAIIIGGVFYFFGPQAKNRTVVTDVMERVVNEEFNFSFAYESGETALSSIESSPEQLGNGSLQQMYVLMESKAMIDFQNKEEGTEAPATISILVFDPDLSSSTLEVATSSTVGEEIKSWAMANNGFTNINLAKGEVEEIKVDGAPAVKYQTDGLYEQDVYIARYRGLVYLFVGQYLEVGDYMDTSFDKVMESVWFE
ncbi:MAG: hypothetical protein R3B60_02145 [Candidatus Paceibacterota bacterium]